MVQDIPGPRDPPGPGSRGENGPEIPQIDDERLLSDTEGGLHRRLREQFHGYLAFKQVPRAVSNR
jgi:hypothetical protein